jgi:hypothetical protein
VSSGNVGIGTTSPATKLHVLGPGGGGVVATFEQPAGSRNVVGLKSSRGFFDIGYGSSLRFMDSERESASLSSHPLGILSFLTNGTSRLVLDSRGNVGIGTDIPGQKLDIEGPIISANGPSAFEVAADVGGSTSLWTNATYSRSSPFSGLVRTLNMKDGKVGIGKTNPQAQLDVAGVVQTSTLQITGGADLAEHFEVRGAVDVGNAASSIQAGLVVSIDPDAPGKLVISSQVYDHKVAGIISGAGGVRPGMLMSQSGLVSDGDHPVALTGRVYCWADASYGPIAPGDLLTTSDNPGHAMKVTDYAKAQGAVLGKAMGALKQGKGLVLALVTLQ